MTVQHRQRPKSSGTLLLGPQMSHSLRSLLNVLEGFTAAVPIGTFNNVLAEYTRYRTEV